MTNNNEIERSSRKLNKAFQKVMEDSYKAMMRDFKSALKNGVETWWWQYDASLGMGREYDELVCKRLVKKAKGEGYHSKMKVSMEDGTRKLYVIVSKNKIAPDFVDDTDELITNIIVLLFILFLACLILPVCL